VSEKSRNRTCSGLNRRKVEKVKDLLLLNSITAMIPGSNHAQHVRHNQKNNTVQIKFQLKAGQPRKTAQ
jgi:hypothetical protein